MLRLAEQRCYNHGQREAVARCLECERFFCRECVTEHENRVVCSDCLSMLAGESSETIHSFMQRAVQSCLAMGGFLLAWLFFYGLGRLLLTIPSSFHEGTFWK